MSKRASESLRLLQRQHDLHNHSPAVQGGPRPWLRRDAFGYARVSTSTRCRQTCQAQFRHFSIQQPKTTTQARPGSSTSIPFIGKKYSQAYWNASCLIFAIAFGLAYSKFNGPLHAEAPRDDDNQEQDQSSPKKRLIRLSEIRSHGAKAEEPWVIYRKGVYDITGWIGAHPGGNVILRAAGGAVDPYWDIFTLHKTQDVYDILEQYRIGDIDPKDLVDGKLPTEDIEDPFVDDPKRDQRLITHTDKPRNAETPQDQLQQFITPMETFYVRNHLWVPRIDEAEQKLQIDLGDGEDEIVYSLEDLRKKFKQHTITATLQCSGNRRKHMSEGSNHATNGIPWDVGAISNAEWSGPLLRDVLKHAGLRQSDMAPSLQHAQFTGEDGYGASIPLHKALDPSGDVILACSMNGKPLPRDHGHPVRVLVPGTVAARSVKFINKITLSDEESTSQWQRKDYKCFGPNCAQTQAHWDEAPAIQEMPVQSAITRVTRGKNTLTLNGYAYSGGGRAIARVDISVDGGKTWSQAEMIKDSAKGSRRWSWQLWRFETELAKVGDSSEVMVKAVDDSYNMQPEDHGPTWNFRGNLTTAWHRMKVDRIQQDTKSGNQGSR